MYLLLYYNDKDCQITLLKPVFSRREQAKAVLKEKTIEYLKQQGCGCAEKLFQKAQKEQEYCIDEESQIEINVEEFEAYIKTENQSPYFATFQILFTGSTGLEGLDFPAYRERNEKTE